MSVVSHLPDRTKPLIIDGVLGHVETTVRAKDTNPSSWVECWGGGHWLNKAPKPHIMGGMLEQGERTHGKSIAKKRLQEQAAKLT